MLNGNKILSQAN
jgi:hypothetical protein